MPATFDLGGFPVDLVRLVRELRTDLGQDWFPDPLRYEDLLSVAAVQKALDDHVSDGDGLFQAEPAMAFDLPKPEFTLRYSMESSLRDRAYYQALVGCLAPYYDELLPNHVLSHRYAFGERRGRYFFRHPVKQWKLFNDHIRFEAKSKPVLLVTDVFNYFENIDVALLVDSLRSRISDISASGEDKARIQAVLDILERCLKSWCHSERRGLPQNRFASSFLANIYMLAVDEAMLQKDYAYYRYMDDIRIATSDRYAARAALRDLIVELRRRHLNVNAAKTKILEPADDGYRDKLNPEDSRLEQLSSMWESKSLNVIRRSLHPLRELATTLLAQGATSDRAFRFCVRRFSKLARCPELGLPDVFFQPLVEAAIQELDAQPAASDQLVELLKSAPTSAAQLARVADFLVDRKKAIYDWQNHLLWQLLVLKKYSEPRLLALARGMTGTDCGAEAGGAMLYLGALGSSADRKRVVTNFRHRKSCLTQRHALIAVHEVPFEKGIRGEVKPHVVGSLHGTYSGIRESFSGCYHLESERVALDSLVDLESPYE